MNTHKYCVYLTTYSGKKLPPYYIGSTSIDKIDGGYNGSVKSKKFKKIYDEEQKLNKHLFKTEILFSFSTRKEALEKELELQVENNVVKSENYFNEALASVNGCFGRDTSGELHPLYGIGHTDETRKKISKNHADISGEKNPKSKLIFIFNKNGEKVFETNGNFKSFCKSHKLPFEKLKHSYQRNGEKLYVNIKEKYRHTIKPENLQYEGWFALEQERP